MNISVTVRDRGVMKRTKNVLLVEIYRMVGTKNFSKIFTKKFWLAVNSLTVDNLGGFMCTSRWGLTSTITWYICRIDLPTEGAYNVFEEKLFLKKRWIISKRVRDRGVVYRTKNIPLVEYYQMTSCRFFEIFEKIPSPDVCWTNFFDYRFGLLVTRGSFFFPHKLNMGFEVSEYLGNGKR